ncbi:hypothetical protein KIMH_00860 [Bombiscardovia apis]|uniref:RCC1-like domain-containing protein n=2 Tax=Bombiscardovia apis TaxID=2932182 RepID=A0ABN6SH92_9BIFI|nr:hypothetical protein KIMH_00860 [Bombiscardovia apis]
MIKAPINTRFTLVSAGANYSLALDSGGHIWSWGVNGNGQLGITANSGNMNPNPNPTDITLQGRTPSSMRTIVAGATHSMALDSLGQVWTWGNNSRGQLGRAGTGQDPTPFNITNQGGLPSSIIQISAGRAHSMALDSNGHIWTWGSKERGQVGDGHMDSNLASSYPTPIDITTSNNLPTNMTQISAGGSFSMALDGNGHIWTWGDNTNKQLAFVPTPIKLPPPPPGSHQEEYERMVAPSPTDITAKNAIPANMTSISAGHSYSMALDSNGHIWTWGSNSTGQLGTTSPDNIVPTDMTSSSHLTSNVSQISASHSINSHSLLVDRDHHIWAWGNNKKGQLGDIQVPLTYSTSPSRVMEPKGATINGVNFGGTTATANTVDPTTNMWTLNVPLHAAGKVNVVVEWSIVWANENGMLATDFPTSATLHYEYIDVGNPPPGSHLVRFDLGGAPGAAPADQYLDGTVQKAQWPSTVPTWENHWFIGWYDSSNQAWDFTQSVTANMTLTAKWEARSFSIDPTQGPTSGGNTVSITAPNPPSLTYAQVSSGGTHTLALGTDGNLYGWGSTYSGELGEFMGIAYYPIRIKTPAGVQFRQVAAGQWLSLALDSRGHVWTMGSNTVGQLGLGTIDDDNHRQPVDISALGKLPTNIVQIQASTLYAMALDSAGHVWTWGSNQNGELGNGSQPSQPIAGGRNDPTDITGQGGLPAGIVQISGAAGSPLALDSAGHVWTWGVGTLRNMQDAGIPVSLKPVPVDLCALGLLPASIAQVSTGDIALDRNGHVWTWGDNSNGQLGNGTVSPSVAPWARPADITALGKLPPSVTQISSDFNSYLVLDSAGHLWTWGWTDNRLGYSSRYDSPTPTDITALNHLSTNIIQISVGHSMSAVLDSNHHILTWGGSSYLGKEPFAPTTNPYIASPIALPKVVVQQVDFDTTKSTDDPSWDETAKVWKVTAPQHWPGTVDVHIRWALDGDGQSDYILPYSFIGSAIALLLPAAGELSRQRTVAVATWGLATSAVLVLVCRQLGLRHKFPNLQNGRHKH